MDELGEVEAEGLSDADAELLGDGLPLEDGDVDDDGDSDGLTEDEGLIDGLTEALGLTEGEPISVTIMDAQTFTPFVTLCSE